MTEIEQLRADNTRLLELLANCHDSTRESGKQISELMASLVSKCADNRANAECDLSRREMFAAMAMQGYLAGRNIDNRDTAREVAMLRCVQYADDLILALDGTEPKGGA